MKRTLKRMLALALVLALGIPTIAFAEDVPTAIELQEVEADSEMLLPEVESAQAEPPVSEVEIELRDFDAGEGPVEAEQTALARVRFAVEPAEALVTVVHVSDAPQPEAIAAEADGTYLLCAGDYLYSVSAEGWRPVENVPFTVGEADVTIECALTSELAENALDIDEAEEAPEADQAEEAPDSDEVEEAPEADQAEEAPEADQGEEAPEAEQVEEAPEAEQVEEAPEAEQVEEAPEAEQGEEAPEADQGEEAPEAEQVEEAPESDQAEEAPEAEQVEEAPEAEQAEEAPEAEQGEEAPEAEQVEAEGVAFDQFRVVGDVVVSVSAEAGVFPENAVLSVERVAVQNDAIDELRDEDANVAVSYTFDIKVIDPDTGEEYQPAEGQTVNVAFSLAEVADENLTTSVYHIADEGTAEKLDVTEADDVTAVVETDGFSLYTVEFTYDNLEYVLKGDTEVALSEVLSSVGLTGEVTAAMVSDETLFSVGNETGTWVVTAHQSFSTQEWMKVTINGVTYEIAVTDDVTLEAASSTTEHNLYVGGIMVTDENMLDVLGDGKVRYDPDSNKLTLTNATIETKPYVRLTSGSTEYGIVDLKQRELTVELVGNNRIVDEEVTQNVGYQEGICFHGPMLTITGSGSLSIDLRKDTFNLGIYTYYPYGTVDVRVDGAIVDIKILNEKKWATGIYLQTNPTIKLYNNAKLTIETGDNKSAYAIDTRYDLIQVDLDVEIGSEFEATCGNAFMNQGKIRHVTAERGMIVNTEPRQEGSRAWNGEEDVNGFKYIYIPADPTRTVRFDKGQKDAEGTMEDVSVQYGEKYTLPGCAFRSEDYIFDHWVVDGESKNPNDRITVTKDVTVTAVWRTREYSLYVGGISVTSENRYDVLEDGGSVCYDPDSNTLTLSRATIETEPYGHESSFRMECGIAYLSSRNLTLKLIGENRIVDEKVTPNVLWQEGINLYGPMLTLTGGGRLTIDLRKDTVNYGIYTNNRSQGTHICVDGATVDISIPSARAAIGIYMQPNPWIELSNKAKLSIETGNYQDAYVLYPKYILTNVNFDVEIGSEFEATCGNAFMNQGKIRGVTVERGMLVNTKPQPDGSWAWDGEEDVSGFKYVCIPAYPTFTVSFDKGLEAAEGSMEDVSVKYGEKYILPNCGFTAKGYTFDHWEVDGESKKPGEKITVTGNVTVTAVWSHNDHVPAKAPEWSWAEDYSTATVTMKCVECGEVIWTEGAEVTGPEYDEEAGTLTLTATATHDDVTYTDTKTLEAEYVAALLPEIDEEGTYRSGFAAHYLGTLGKATLIFSEADGHPGARVEVDALWLDTFKFDLENQAILKYLGDAAKIELPARVVDPDDGNHRIPLTTLGGQDTRFIQQGEAPVEITDWGNINYIDVGAFSDLKNVTLTLTGEAPIDIAVDSFDDCENVTLRVNHASGLSAGENDDAQGKYTVEMLDDHTYETSALWADDYSAAQLALSCACGESHTFDATSVTRTENPENHHFAFTATGEYEGKSYTVTLSDVESYRVTVNANDGQGNQETYVPIADGKRYAMFTASVDWLTGLVAPLAADFAELIGDDGESYPGGETVKIEKDTVFTARWRSVWAKVNAALGEGKSVKLYSDITPAEGDVYLHVPAGVTATLDLNGFTADRKLTTATQRGYVALVEGTFDLKNSGALTGGNNSGNGGGVFINAGGRLNASNGVKITRNLSAGHGGGVYIAKGGYLSFDSGEICYNEAKGDGGGIYMVGEAEKAPEPEPEPENDVISKAASNDVVSTRLLNIYENIAGGHGGGLRITGTDYQPGEGTSIVNNHAKGKLNNLYADEASQLKLPDPDTISADAPIKIGLGGGSFAAGGVITSANFFKWVFGTLGGGAAIIAALKLGKLGLFNDDKEGEETEKQDDSDCKHPKFTIEVGWEDSHYSSAIERRTCTLCGKVFLDSLTPTISVTEDQVTVYTVTRSDSKKETRQVQPYVVNLNVNLPGGLTLPEGFDGLRVIRTAHLRGEDATVPLPDLWLIIEGLMFEGWDLDGNLVVRVKFDADDTKSKQIQGRWKVPILYEAGVTQEEDPSLKGNAPQDPNPTWVELGTTHDLKKNQWKRDNYAFIGWEVADILKLVFEDGILKLVFGFSGDGEAVPEEKTILVTAPTLIRAKWISKWKKLNIELNTPLAGGEVAMQENIKATRDDVTMELPGESTLNMMGKTLDAGPGADRGVFNVVGNLTVRGSGTIKNGIRLQGAGVNIEESGTFTLEDGKIINNRLTSENGKGAGIYVGGTLRVSGNAVVKDNGAPKQPGDLKPNNIYLPEGKKIEVVGKLHEKAELHVTMEKPGVITSGLNAKDEDPEKVRGKAENFVSDDEDYRVVINDDGEAELRRKYKIIIDEKITHGKVEASAEEAEKGEFIELTVTADEGYDLKQDSLKATYKEKDEEKTLDLEQKAGSQKRQYRFEMPAADVNVTAEFESTGPQFRTHSLALTGEIAVNFFMELPEMEGVDYSKSYMEFTVQSKDGATTKVPYDAEFKDASGKGYYGFTAYVNAIQMACPIHAVFHYGEGKTVEQTYTVKDYIMAYEKVKDSFDDATTSLVHALADYGHYAQPALADYNGWTIGTDYAEMDVYYNKALDIDGAKAGVSKYAMKMSLGRSAVTNFNFTLNLLSQTEMRVIVTLKSGYKGNATYTLDGKEVTPEPYSGGRYSVSVTDIPAHELDDWHTVTVKTTSGTATFRVAPFTYVQWFLNDSRQIYRESVAALYYYNKAAEAYREAYDYE